MFSALVDRIQTMNGDVSGNREIQALYEQITKLQAKVTASLEEAVQRQRMLRYLKLLLLWFCKNDCSASNTVLFRNISTEEAMQANGKIDQAVKIYDHLLQERLNSTYQRRMNANNYGHPDHMQQPVAPGSDYAPQAYPQLTGVDSRYAPYTSGAPYNQQQHIPPFPVSTHPSYQSSLPPATAPFVPSSGYAASSGNDYGGSAPFAPVQDPYYASAPAPAPAPSTTLYQHQDYSTQAYAPAPPGAVNLMDSVGQPSYAPYAGQQQPYATQHAPQAPGQGYGQGQGAESVVSPAPVVSPSTAPTHVVPVEEKPLIEF